MKKRFTNQVLHGNEAGQVHAEWLTKEVPAALHPGSRLLRQGPMVLPAGREMEEAHLPEVHRPAQKEKVHQAKAILRPGTSLLLVKSSQAYGIPKIY